jgi:hypothetical protein
MNKKKFKYGGYAASMSAGLIVVILLLNLLITSLDDKYDLSLDLTANRVYSLTQKSEHILEELDRDIYIYTLYSQGKEDQSFMELMEKYKSKSKHIHVRNIDVVKNPGAVSFYENKKDININGNGAIVSTSADPTDPKQNFKVLSQYDFYSYDAKTQSITMFTGEDAITGAIKYVLDPNIPKVWFLEGHGTTSANWAEMRLYLEEENYDTGNLSLVTNPNGLKKGDILIVLGPKDDLSNDERGILLDFALDGGKIMFLFNPTTTNELPNFKKILSHYNLTLEDGLVVEQKENNYYREQVVLVPNYKNSEITNQLKNGKMPVLVQFGGAIGIGPDQNGITIESLIETSDQSFLEPYTESFDQTMNDGAKVGPFPLAVSVQKAAKNDKDEVKMIVMNSESVFVGMTQYNSGNDEFFLNAISWLNPNENDFYIRGKSLKTSSLYIKNSAQLFTIILVVCGIIPLAAFVTGIVVFLRRRHK